MTACKTCGTPIEPVVQPTGIQWVHLGDRSTWCHITRAEPDGSLPAIDEVRELLDLGWTATAIAQRYAVSRDRVARLIRTNKLDRRTA